MTAERMRFVLLVGAPRSGTTWLQSMLGAHAAVTTPQETDLFHRYVRPLTDAWEWQLRGGPEGWRSRRYKGLPGVLTTKEFSALVQGVVDAALDGIARLGPDASVLLEKSPSHSLCADLVAAYAPDTKVIHVVRDGREVAASLVAAAEGWASNWAPATIPDAARSWVRHVEGAQRYRTLGLDYHEVRYEVLTKHDPDVLRRAYEFCGLDVTADECAARYKQHSLEATGDPGADPIRLGGEFAEFAADRTEPEGFAGLGTARGWRSEWDTRDRLRFREIAGDLLVRLGYEPDDQWAASKPRALVYRAESTARRGIASGARRAARRSQEIARRLS
ncbi:MAG: sulfotransferase family protein [Acidimicrobiia bacterium]